MAEPAGAEAATAISILSQMLENQLSASVVKEVTNERKN